MSIPLDRLYHYIQDIAEEVRGDCVLIYRFSPHGSKNIEDLQPLKKLKDPFLLNSLFPVIVCHDQEPLNYNFYKNNVHTITKTCINSGLFDRHDTSLRVPVTVIYDKSILLHSEQHSNNVQQYKNSSHIPVYYWSHALIAHDWFRYAKHVDITPSTTQKQFLIYNRAWAGTREYRLKFVELLQQNKLVNDCQISFNAVDSEHNVEYTDHVFKNIAFKPTSIQDILPVTTAPSHASADFVIEDYANTKFEVVLETLFDDERIQLTEKILRPIACGHPFILASTAGSLEYLRKYGFKTFNGIIDETYDSEQDPVKRLHLIIDSMKIITTWTKEEQILNWKKINEITKYNKQHFFSAKFFNSIIDELKNNLKKAFDELENTNTGKNFINFRKKYNMLPEMQDEKIQAQLRQYRKNIKDDLIPILLKARSYYNRYLKTLN